MIRLNVGLSKKLGMPNFGSKGGSIHLEIELADLEQQKLRESIAKLFGLAKQALEDELGSDNRDLSEKPGLPNPANPMGVSPGEELGVQGKTVSERQVRFLQVLASRQRRDLARNCLERFGKPVHELQGREASTLIEEWNKIGAGSGKEAGCGR